MNAYFRAAVVAIAFILSDCMRGEGGVAELLSFSPFVI